MKNPNEVHNPICWVLNYTRKEVFAPIGLQTYVEKGKAKVNTIIPILQMISSGRETQTDSSRIAQGM